MTFYAEHGKADPPRTASDTQRASTFRKKKRTNLSPYLTPYTKINFTWIDDLNVNDKTLFSRRRQENIFLTLGNVFLIRTPKSVTIKEIERLNSINVKNFHSSKTRQ